MATITLTNLAPGYTATLQLYQRGTNTTVGSAITGTSSGSAYTFAGVPATGDYDGQLAGFSDVLGARFPIRDCVAYPLDSWIVLDNARVGGVYYSPASSTSSSCGQSALSHVVTVEDYTVSQGATWRVSLDGIQNVDGTFISLTGKTFRGQARREPNSSTLAFSYTFTPNTTTTPHSLVVELSATALDSLTPLGNNPRAKDSQLYYDWEMVDGAEVSVFQRGVVSVVRNVTR